MTEKYNKPVKQQANSSYVPQIFRCPRWCGPDVYITKEEWDNEKKRCTSCPKHTTQEEKQSTAIL